MPNDQQVYGGVEYSVTVKWSLDFAFVAGGPGPVALTPGMTLGPYETYSATFECAGVAASGSGNDVEVEGSFTEAVTGRTESPRDTLTVVKVELEAEYMAPENASQSRHVYGVGEREKFKVSLYFKYTFACCVDTYRKLPEAVRPAFVEQIKRDFFHRKGMAFVDLNEFPPEFRK